MWSKIKKHFFSVAKIVLPLFLGGGLLWYIYKDIDFEHIINILHLEVRYEYLLFSLVFGLAANVVRGIRWELLITPFGYKPRKTVLTLAVLGSYAVNLVLPRIGEFWRCGITAKYEKESFSRLFGTLLVDRLYDIFSVGGLLLLSFILLPDFYLSIFQGGTSFSAITPRQVLLWGGTVLVIAVSGWMLVRFCRRFAFFARIKAFFTNVLDGFRSICTMKHKGRFLAYTAAIWLLYFFYFYVTFFAFNFTRDLWPTCGLAVFVLSCISIALPVQGGFGPWHYAVILGLGVLGTTHDDAAAFALIVHTTQTLWVALVGLISILSISLFFKPIKEEQS